MNPLLDSDFLVKLNNDKNRTIYAHVISLNQYEHPIEQLEGVVTAGSITIDGQSAVRRVCSLTLSAKNLNINNVYWGLSTKVKIEIGLQNNITTKYNDIIWFPQGVFILTDFKTTQTINNYTINLTGKDKMCMLNGDVSGNFPAPVRFDSYTDATAQSYILKQEDEGNYNNFIDDDAANAILEGFQEQYGSDYQFIRGAKKILSLEYTPNGALAGKIKFSPTAEEYSISSLCGAPIQNSITGKNTYSININENDIYGFIVSGCNTGDEFSWTIEQKIPIAIIIQEMLHQFGQERYSNVIIKDIEPYALEMLDSAFENKYYLLHNGDIYCKFITQEELISNYILYGVTSKDDQNKIQIDENNNITNIIFRNFVDEDDNSLIDILSGSTIEEEVIRPTEVIENNNSIIKYTVQPIENKTVAGYGMTLLVYPDELTCSPGDSITSILDKIVNMLGDYEYFYDLQGQFVFQAKPAYVKTPWNNMFYSDDENYVEASELYSRVAYTFDDSVLTTQYQNTPNMNNIKNDYIIWGEKKNLSGNTIKFHGRYAIDNIPFEYTDFNGFTWTSNKKNSLKEAILEKRDKMSNNYQHIYQYPSGYSPEEGGWWEVNDWANYYSMVFGIDLSKNTSPLRKYHTWTVIDEENENIFKQYFLNDYSGSKFSGNTDVVSILYTDETKTEISSVYSHGNCTHYYAQFMDLRLLDQGWGYTAPQKNNLFTSSIINAFDADKKFLLNDNKTRVTTGFHPDYVTSFIYKPVLPTDSVIYESDEVLSLIYPDIKNENGNYRQYALPYDVDWRHLIHVMADDWYAHHTEDDYEINLRMNNSWPDLDINLYPYGRTGYEQYYLDFTSSGGFWQELYDIYSIRKVYYDIHSILDKNDYKYIQANQVINTEGYLDRYFANGSYKYWNRDVIENPERLNFWFDFFKADEMGIGKFAISVIGDRPKTVNDSAIKTIIYRDTPDVIYCSWTEYESYKRMKVLKDGYKYLIIGNNGESYLADNIDEILSLDDTDENKIALLESLSDLPMNIKQNFVRSIRFKSVHDQADTMLYQYSYYNDTVNINSVPIYYLQPNTIISTKDELSKVTGYYVINKINISLAYNGMMQIDAIKSPERIY